MQADSALFLALSHASHEAVTVKSAYPRGNEKTVHAQIAQSGKLCMSTSLPS